MIQTEYLALPATVGGAGVATATKRSTHPIEGKLLSIELLFAGSAAPGTTDISLLAVADDGFPNYEFWTAVVSANTGPIAVGKSVVTGANVAIPDSFVPIPIAGYVQCDVTVSNSGVLVTAKITYEK